METTMSEKPDSTKIEAALTRAAHKALHGTREERSGRFLKREERKPAYDDLRDVAKAADRTNRKLEASKGSK